MSPLCFGRHSIRFWDLLCWSDYHEVTSTIYAQTLGVRSLGFLLYMTHSGRGQGDPALLFDGYPPNLARCTKAPRKTQRIFPEVLDRFFHEQHVHKELYVGENVCFALRISISILILLPLPLPLFLVHWHGKAEMFPILNLHSK